MSKVVIEYNGSDYTLEFDRASVMKAEKMYDISVSEITSGKSYVVQALFRAAFIKHHGKMNVKVIDSIFEDVADKTGLYEALTEMYYETANETLAEPEEGKALAWKRV